jgi:gliding motility-associated-like protein
VISAASNPLINSKFIVGKTPLTFEAIDTFGNKSTCTFEIEVLGIQTPNILQNDTLICGNGLIDLKATGIIPGATYKWTGPNGYTNTGATISVNVPTNPIGVYKVTQITDEGCTSKSDSINIGVIPAPVGADDKYDVVTGKALTGNVTTNDKLQKTTPYSTNLKTDVKPEAGKLKLNPDGTFTFDAKAGFVGIASFVYEICYTDCKKCSNALIVSIDVKPDNTNCEVPNVVTPNGDNLNDFLVIDCAVGKADNELTVFNRWGEQVFNAKPYDGVNAPWDATYKAKALPDGTYFYIYKDSATAEAKKGYITIFR